MIFDRLQIFISSSMDELEHERATVKLALAELEVDAWIFEQDAGARIESPQTTFRAELEKSDLYIGLFWTKLGEYTLEEYRRAVAFGKDTLIYEKRDVQGTRSRALQQFLDSAGDVTAGRTIRCFDDPENLERYVKEDVAAWQAAKIRKQIVAVRTPSAAAEPERHWLLSLLHKVNQFWIENVLERSLNREGRLDISLESNNKCVEHPWEQVVVLPDRRPRISQRPIQEIFAESQQLLLILGAPGAGKTITLLELTRHFIQRAKDDAREPVPVVLNLASWHRGELFAWIENELGLRYQIPKRVGRKLLDDHQILLLLDGLDEVRSGERRGCIQEINHFLEKHGAAGLTVCCREEDYEELQPAKLRFGGAVRLRPLESSKIDEYLERAGPSLVGLRRALESDAALRELAQTPLLLDMMRIAYRDMPAETVARSARQSLDERRRALMNSYIDQMFERRGQNGSFSRDVSLIWLSNLARKLRNNNETVFQFETLQPTWLGGSRARQLYVLLTRSLTAVPLGLLWASVPAFLFWWSAGFGVGLFDLRRFGKPSGSPAKWKGGTTCWRLLKTAGIAYASALIFFITPYVAQVFILPSHSAIEVLQSLRFAGVLVGVYLIPSLLQDSGLTSYYYLPLLTVSIIIVPSLPFAARISFWNSRMDVRRAEAVDFRWRRFAGILFAITAVLSLFLPRPTYERGEHVRLGDGRTGAITAILSRSEDVRRFGFCPDGSVAWAGYSPVSIWRTRDGKLLNRQQTGGDPLFSPDCKHYALSISPFGSAGLWDVDAGWIGVVRGSGNISWSRDSRELYVTESYKAVVVYGAADLRVIHSFQDPEREGYRKNFQVSHDKRYAVETYFGTRDEGRVWDLETGRLLPLRPSSALALPVRQGPGYDDERPLLQQTHVMPPDAGYVFLPSTALPPLRNAPQECHGQYSFSPNRRFAMTNDMPRCLCESATGRVILRISDNSGLLSGVRWSSDSTRVAIDRVGGLWDTSSGVLIASLPKEDYFAFSSDSARIAGFGQNGVALWDARDGRPIKTLVVSRGAILFGPAGEQFLIEAQPADYSGAAQIIVVFGSMIAFLLSFRTTPFAASVRRSRGFRALASRAAGAGLIVGLVVLAAGAFTIRWPIRLVELFATGFALAFWFCGGMDLFHHFLLRGFMVGEKVMPWRWEPFLNFSVDLALMRKVGDGYIFLHRLLLEHLADLPPRPNLPPRSQNRRKPGMG